MSVRRDGKIPKEVAKSDWNVNGRWVMSCFHFFGSMGKVMCLNISLSVIKNMAVRIVFSFIRWSDKILWTKLHP